MPDELNYTTYLLLDELLTLQRPQSSPVHADELLFIVVHQASELWFKVMLQELDGLVGAFEDADTGAALASVMRLNSLMRVVTGQLSALETLPPQRFAEFRKYLGQSSGSQSAQFRALELASGFRDPHFLEMLKAQAPLPAIVTRALARPTLQELFDGLLEAHGVTLDALYAHHAQTPLFLLAEALLEYEQGFARWRFLHVQLVQRIIGPETAGTAGSLGARDLERTIGQRLFSNLWAVRSRIYR